MPGQITYRAATTAWNNNGGVDPAIPAGTVNGDLMIFFASMKGAPTAGFTMPAGWTAIIAPRAHSVNSGSGPGTMLGWRIKQTGDGAPGANGNGNGIVASVVSCYGDFSLTKPINIPTSGVPNDTGDQNTASANSLTPRHEDDLIFFIVGYGDGDGGGTSVTSWPGTNPTFTERADISQVGDLGGNAGLAIATGEAPNTDAVTGRTAGLGGTRFTSSYLFSVAPAVNSTVRMII